MEHQYTQHYTREQARSLLPQIRAWLVQLRHLREQVEKADRRLEQLLAVGSDAGGGTVNDWVRALANLKNILQEFDARQIQVKDLERGLVDFPAILAGREVFLCWEQDEEDIEFWHDLDTGFAGRERL
jgi:hypothetical protein